MTSWRFVENAILNGEMTSHDAKFQDPPNIAPVSPPTPQLTSEHKN